MASHAKSIHSEAVVNSPPERPDACDICTALRACRLGACDDHTIVWPWWRAGHATPHDAAFAHLVRVDEQLGERQPDPLALVGSLCVALLRRSALALESVALGADRTRRDLLTALAEGRALRGAA